MKGKICKITISTYVETSLFRYASIRNALLGTFEIHFQTEK